VVDVDAETRPRFLLELRRNVRRALRKIADVPDARLDVEFGAEVVLDRAGLGRRFDNH
jgi:hypothetical protein